MMSLNEVERDMIVGSYTTMKSAKKFFGWFSLVTIIAILAFGLVFSFTATWPLLATLMLSLFGFFFALRSQRTWQGFIDKYRLEV